MIDRDGSRSEGSFRVTQSLPDAQSSPRQFYVSNNRGVGTYVLIGTYTFVGTYALKGTF
jgi:hypothetical protein